MPAPSGPMGKCSAATSRWSRGRAGITGETVPRSPTWPTFPTAATGRHWPSSFRYPDRPLSRVVTPTLPAARASTASARLMVACWGGRRLRCTGRGARSGAACLRCGPLVTGQPGPSQARAAGVGGVGGKHADELALLETLDMGKPVRDARRIDLPGVVRCLRWTAEAVDKLYGEVAPTGPHELGLVTREPAGVVAAIVPWNFPLLMACWKIAPALAMGNSVVLAFRALAPECVAAGGAGRRSGLPEGVLNVLPGHGARVGEPLALHMDVDVLAFTGSTATARGCCSIQGGPTSSGSGWSVVARARTWCLPMPRSGCRCEGGGTGHLLQPGRGLYCRVTAAGAALDPRGFRAPGGCLRPAHAAAPPA